MKKLIPHALVIWASSHLTYVGAAESNNWYIGGIYGEQVLYGIASDSYEFNSLGIIAGYQYSQYISLETRVSKGISGYEVNQFYEDIQLINYSADINYQASILIKASYPVTDAFYLYGIAGYSETNVDIENTEPDLDEDTLAVISDLLLGSFDRSFSESGLTYGMGLSYELNDKLNVFVDYQVFPGRASLVGSSEDWNSINVGFSYGF
ncbi:MAG: opacity protein-like surface antigen [Bermanella sp.]|jgi:opacity protein-like surface antigen